MQLCCRGRIPVWGDLWDHIWRPKYDWAGNWLSSRHSTIARLRAFNPAGHVKTSIPRCGKSDCGLCDRGLYQCASGTSHTGAGVRIGIGIGSWCGHGSRELLHAIYRMGRGPYAREAYGRHRSWFDPDRIRTAIRAVLGDPAWSWYQLIPLGA